MKKRKCKNPHAVALGRLGGLVRSEAKQRANRETALAAILVVAPAASVLLVAGSGDAKAKPGPIS